MKKSKKTVSFPELLGSSLAFLQVKIDDGMQYIFDKVYTAGKTKLRKDAHFSRIVIQKSAQFIGGIGKGFYEEYKNLKVEQKKEATRPSSKSQKKSPSK